MGIEGLDDLHRALGRVRETVSGPNLADDLEAAAVPIAREAARRAPVDTGRLRASIEVTRTGVGRADATVEIGTDVPYARRIEYGFMGRDRLGRLYHQTARPYLRPAFDHGAQAATERLRSGLEARIRRAARGPGR